jgi:WS/DGAT/MGAT family acyltransferase
MFLMLEEADEGAHMHIGAALVFDPLPDGRVPRIDAVRERVSERLPLLPRFGQRLSSPRTRPLHWLTWEPAGPVDLEAHVHHARLPSPGRDADLLEWVGDYWSHRLDRRRPLWEVTLVDGLRGHRWALVTKTHHCLVDGVGGIDIGNVLLDDVTAPPPAEQPAAGRGGRFWLSPDLLVRGAAALRHPARLLVEGAAMTNMLVREEVVAAPPTSLNAEISGLRTYEVARFALADLKEIRTAMGGTVNDVLLTLSAGALRRLLLSRGEEPPSRGLRAQVPVNLRSDDEQHALGNRLTSLYVDLPVAVADPLVRYQLVRERTAALKHSSQPIGGRALVASSAGLPPGVGAAIARTLYGGTRMFNLTITNVPGPQEPLAAWGAPMREVLPFLGLFAGHGLAIAVFSYAGEIVFGLTGDRAVCPDVGIAAEGLQEAFDELRPSVHRRGVRAERRVPILR